MDANIQKRSGKFSIFGIFLIMLGAGLILSKLHLLQYDWSTILWICLGVVGLALLFRHLSGGGAEWFFGEACCSSSVLACLFTNLHF
jgi:hypothetical protein